MLKRDLAKGEFHCWAPIRHGERGVIIEVKFGEAWVCFDEVMTDRGPAEASFRVTDLPMLIDPIHPAPAPPSDRSEENH